MSGKRVVRVFALAVLLVGGCEASAPGGDFEDACGPLPDRCVGHCTTSLSGLVDDTACCDSFFCNCDPVEHTWEPLYCDRPAPPDAAPPDAGPMESDAGSDGGA